MERIHKEAINLCIEYCILYYAESAARFQEVSPNTKQILSYALDHQLNSWDLAEVGAYSPRLQCESMNERYAIFRWLWDFIHNIFLHSLRCKWAKSL